MSETVKWTNDALADKFFHPIIAIGVFVIHFLSIHPFTDGNGRLSRALTVMLMLKSGYTYMPYASMESIIEATKDAYYRALRGTQKTIWGDKIDYEPWLTFFVRALVAQKRQLEEKIAKARGASATKLSATQNQILELFHKTPELTMPQIVSAMDKNPETIRKAVQALVKRGHISKQGTTRGVFYTLH